MTDFFGTVCDGLPCEHQSVYSVINKFVLFFVETLLLSAAPQIFLFAKMGFSRARVPFV